MSVQLTPFKRQYNRRNTESNGKRKKQKSSGYTSQNSPLKVSAGSTVFRVLCPVSKIGSVIGKGGSIISQIRQQTGAKVRIEDNVSGCDERLIVIVGSDKDSGVAADRNKEDSDETKTSEEVDDVKEHGDGNGNEDKQSIPKQDLQSEEGTLSIQKALLLVFERIAEGELETDGGDEETNGSSTLSLRLLVFSSQVDHLLGKDGSLIKQMSSDTGAQIQILPREKLPSLASTSDELVQITGEVDVVRKALQSVSQQLLENPPRDQDSFPANPSGTSSYSSGNVLPRPEAYLPPNNPFTAQGAHYAGRPLNSRLNESGFPGSMHPPRDILTFRLLCHEDKVGGVIGKGGTVVNALQNETGCEIIVLDDVSNSEDRIIVIAGPVHPDDEISAAQDAVLRVQSRIARVTPESQDNTMQAKLLVDSNQIGCLLGKGGAIIAEMRKLSRAYIRILPKDQLPKCVSENEEVVQINGEVEAVQDAILHVTTRLRNHFFRDAFSSINHPSNPSFPDQVPPFPSYMGRREHSPPRMYSNIGLPFHKFDAGGGLPPHGGFHPHDDRLPFMPNIHRPGMLPHMSDRNPSSAWGPQGLIEGGGPLGLPDYTGAPQRRLGGFGVGSHQAIITNTTVQVVVPRSVVPVIKGEDGGCLKQIREISDAKITIKDPKPGATEAEITISGTPEQTHAAQSLIQAFVISETVAP